MPAQQNWVILKTLTAASSLFSDFENTTLLFLWDQWGIDPCQKGAFDLLGWWSILGVAQFNWWWKSKSQLRWFDSVQPRVPVEKLYSLHFPLLLLPPPANWITYWWSPVTTTGWDENRNDQATLFHSIPLSITMLKMLESTIGPQSQSHRRLPVQLQLAQRSRILLSHCAIASTVLYLQS